MGGLRQLSDLAQCKQFRRTTVEIDEGNRRRRDTMLAGSGS